MITENTKNGQSTVCWSSNTTATDGIMKSCSAGLFLYNAFPAYIDPAGRKFNENLLTCRSKAYPIPDDAKLYRWVLRDGTVVTTTHEFPQSDCAHLYTFDGRYMYVPESNIAYVMEDVASVTGEVSGDVQDR